jgi:hypothetical protein
MRRGHADAECHRHGACQPPPLKRVFAKTHSDPDSGRTRIPVGEQRVRVVGNVTCVDTESSLSAPSSNVVITGKTTGCTGYKLSTPSFSSP